MCRLLRLSAWRFLLQLHKLVCSFMARSLTDWLQQRRQLLLLRLQLLKLQLLLKLLLRLKLLVVLLLRLELLLLLLRILLGLLLNLLRLLLQLLLNLLLLLQQQSLLLVLRVLRQQHLLLRLRLHQFLHPLYLLLLPCGGSDLHELRHLILHALDQLLLLLLLLLIHRPDVVRRLRQVVVDHVREAGLGRGG